MGTDGTSGGDLGEARFRRLYASHERDLLAFALRRTHQPADAADVVAEAFVVAWRRLGDVPEDAERLWLFGVASRVLSNQSRGRLRQHRLAERLRDELQRTIAPPAASEEDSEQAAITGALARLSARDREILRLTAWEELTPQECAIVLGCSAVTARSRLHRARRRLKEQLADHVRPSADGPARVPAPTCHDERSE